jgi:hypothetical protein
MAALYLVYGAFLAAPFAAAVLMPNLKWLLVFTALAAGGLFLLDGVFAPLAYLAGASVGIVSRSAGLAMRANGYRFPQTHIPTLLALVVLAVAVFQVARQFG